MLRRSDQTLQCNRAGSGFSVSLTVEPEDGETELFGKYVEDLQEDVLVGNNSISGNLKYVTEYTGFSGDPNEQEGHYLALKFEATEGATTTVEIIGGDHGPVELDSDMNIVCRIKNNHQKIKVVTSLDGASITKVYDLSTLELLPPTNE